MIKIPKIGFGTWQIHGDEAVQATLAALKAGYRLIDTAKIYGNEREVGQAIKRSGVPRSEILITTKLWNRNQGYGSALEAFDESLGRLGLDYIDLYLIHWPGHDREKRLESWKALEQLHSEKKARAIGVSNFTPEHLEELAEHSAASPSVNQIEFHPFIYDRQLPTLEYCKQHGVVVEAYSPLDRAQSMNHPLITAIAEQKDRTNAQVMLRWAIQHGTVPIPKSSNPERIKENLEVFDLELSKEEMQVLDGLGSGKGESALPFWVKLIK